MAKSYRVLGHKGLDLKYGPPKSPSSCENCGRSKKDLRKVIPTGVFAEEEAEQVWCFNCRTFWPHKKVI